MKKRTGKSRSGLRNGFALNQALPLFLCSVFVCSLVLLQAGTAFAFVKAKRMNDFKIQAVCAAKEFAARCASARRCHEPLSETWSLEIEGKDLELADQQTRILGQWNQNGRICQFYVYYDAWGILEVDMDLASAETKGE